MPSATFDVTVAAWRHSGGRDGFEVAFFDPIAAGLRVTGSTTGVEDGDAFVLDYDIVLDERWHTRTAQVVSRSAGKVRATAIRADGRGRWVVDGDLQRHLEGCHDLDLESSALTNAFPMRRLDLDVGEGADAPAAYVRAFSGSIERLEQRYRRLSDVDGRLRCAYEAPAFDFRCEITYDVHGLVVDYPGIATRAR